MRIVHDIDYPASVSGSPDHPRPISKGDSKNTKFRVNLLIVSPDPFGCENAIHIEGDGACIRDALKEAIEIIDAIAEDWIKENSTPPNCENRVVEMRPRRERVDNQPSGDPDE